MPSYSQDIPVWQQWPNTLRFRPPHDKRRSIVKGGRWFVRRCPEKFWRMLSVEDKPWKAYNASRRRTSRWFATQEEAFAYALKKALDWVSKSR